MPVYSLFMSPSGQDKLYQVKNFVFLNLCYSPSNSKVTGIQQALDEYKIKSFFNSFLCMCGRRGRPAGQSLSIVQSMDSEIKVFHNLIQLTDVYTG